MTATFILLSYNQEAYVEEAVRAALLQTGEPLEILISDDASTDGTFDMIRVAVDGYVGPHKVQIHRNAANQGICAHINQAMAMTTGDPVVVAAADDVSFPERTVTLLSTFAREDAMLVHSDVVPIGTPAHVAAFDRHIRPGALFMGDWDLPACAVSMSLYVGATAAWRRALFDRYGPLPAQDCYEDLVLGFRAALGGGVTRVRESLVHYRVGQGQSDNDARFSDFDSYCAVRLRGLVRELATLTQRQQDARTHGLPADHPVFTVLRCRIDAVAMMRNALTSSFLGFALQQRRNLLSAYRKYARLRRQVRAEYDRVTGGSA